MPQKVLIVSNFHEDASISRSNMAYKYFLEKGYQTTVLYASFSHSLKKYRELSNEHFVSLSTLSYSSSLSIKRIISYVIYTYRAYKYLGNQKFDLVYINLPPNSVGLALLLRKRQYSKLIVDIIDLWPEAFPHNNSQLKRTAIDIIGFIPKMIRKRSIKYCDFCITESEFFHKELKLTNSVNTKVIHIKKFQTETPIFDDISDVLSIVYLGNIGNIYDFTSLLTILKEVAKKRKVVLHILGLGPMKDWLFDNLNSIKIDYYYHGASFDEIKKREIISKCWFGYNGYKDNTEVALSYKSIDYLSFGVPLINSAKEDSFRLVEDENIGYNFNSKEIESLISKLSIITVGDVFQMKRQAYDTFTKKFSGQSYQNDMDTVLDSISKK